MSTRTERKNAAVEFRESIKRDWRKQVANVKRAGGLLHVAWNTVCQESDKIAQFNPQRASEVRRAALELKREEGL